MYGCCRMGVRRLGERVKKGLRSTDWLLQNSHGCIKYSIRNIVNNVITTYDSSWVLKISGGTFFKAYDCLAAMLYT